MSGWLTFSSELLKNKNCQSPHRKPEDLTCEHSKLIIDLTMVAAIQKLEILAVFVPIYVEA